jgi:type I restriction enzyme, S subunit
LNTFINAKREIIYGLGTGSTFPNVSSQTLESINFPLPPLNEQRRIVEKIEALSAHSRNAREALDAIPALLEQFRQSVLAAAFRGDLTADWRAQHPDVEPAQELVAKAKQDKERILGTYTEPSPLEVDELPEIPNSWIWSLPQTLSAHESNSICAGPFGTIFKAKDFRDKGIPIIFLRHVAQGEYLTHKPGFMDIEKWEELFQPYSVYGGELLITKLGDPPGTCAIYPEDIGPAMVTPDVIKMSNNSDVSESQYLMHYFNSELSKKIAFGVAYGVTRLRMNLTIFRSLPVPVAPLEEQAEICKQIKKIFASITLVEEQYLSNCIQLSELDQSILAKAFRGQLVPQDPTDEPASHLLARIRTERQTAAKTTQAKPARKPKHRTP